MAFLLWPREKRDGRGRGDRDLFLFLYFFLWGHQSYWIRASSLWLYLNSYLLMTLSIKTVILMAWTSTYGFWGCTNIQSITLLPTALLFSYNIYHLLQYYMIYLFIKLVITCLPVLEYKLYEVRGLSLFFPGDSKNLKECSHMKCGRRNHWGQQPWLSRWEKRANARTAGNKWKIPGNSNI